MAFRQIAFAAPSVVITDASAVALTVPAGKVDKCLGLTLANVATVNRTVSVAIIPPGGGTFYLLKDVVIPVASSIDSVGSNQVWPAGTKLAIIGSAVNSIQATGGVLRLAEEA